MKPDLKPASAVFDNGRRGNPLISCDCVVCFGYCLTDPDVIARESRSRSASLPEGDHDASGFASTTVS